MERRHGKGSFKTRFHGLITLSKTLRNILMLNPDLRLRDPESLSIQFLIRLHWPSPMSVKCPLSLAYPLTFKPIQWCVVNKSHLGNSLLVSTVYSKNWSRTRFHYQWWRCCRISRHKMALQSSSFDKGNANAIICHAKSFLLQIS